MKRLTKHINPASVLALVALVFAVTGGAYAAGNGGGGGSGQGAGRATAFVAKSKSKKKSSVGKPGPRGPAGVAGATGPAGPAGAAGAKGETGPAGANGTNGKDGNNGVGTEGKAGTGATTKSFTGVMKVGSEECTEGGLEVKSASGTSLVCNGEKGAQGNPAQFPETLPAGRSQTGTWTMTITNNKYEEGGEVYYTGFANISYPIPVSAVPTNVEVLPPGGGDTANCPGTLNGHRSKCALSLSLHRTGIPGKRQFLASYPILVSHGI